MPEEFIDLAIAEIKAAVLAELPEKTDAYIGYNEVEPEATSIFRAGYKTALIDIKNVLK